MSKSINKQKIADALQEPAAPAALVERTVVRARALTEGREAERLLAQESGPGPRTAELAARSIVGRLMHTNLPPENASVEKMTLQLLSDPRFKSVEEKDPGTILKELKSGALIRSFAPEGKEKERQPDTPQLKSPVLSKPTPMKGGPSL